MDVKVELRFNSNVGSGPFFEIGDAERGVIGNTDYVLGGSSVYVDVTQQLLSFDISRGKSRELNKFEAGQLNLSFDNNNRFFDPNYEASPYYGQIVPRREIKVTVDGQVQFVGIVEDWSLSYDPSGISTASCVAIDSTAYLAGENLSFSSGSELTGARINAVLDDIGWPAELRDIDTGLQTLEAQALVENITVIDYLNRVSESEPGSLFVDKVGNVKFVDRAGGGEGIDLVFTDEGDGIPYETIEVVYGSELLYNNIALSNSAGTATVSDSLSLASYGIRDLAQETLINNAGLEPTARYLLSKYKNPEFRFEGLSLNLYNLEPSVQADLLSLELGDIVGIEFTPSGIPPSVVKTVRIIKIDHSASPAEYRITFGFESLVGLPLIIGSEVFGIIGTNTVGF